MSCETCQYYRAHSSQLKKGDCRRHAPVPGVHANQIRFPHVAFSDWCGEYKCVEGLPDDPSLPPKPRPPLPHSLVEGDEKPPVIRSG